LPVSRLIYENEFSRSIIFCPGRDLDRNGPPFGQKADRRAANGLLRKGRCRVRKKRIVLALIGLACLLLAVPVLAAGAGRDAVLAVKKVPRSQHQVISMTGRIEAVDTANKRIYVTVQLTNKPHLVVRGKTVWVGTTSTTVYYVWKDKIRRRATFGALAVGQKVSINARVAKTATTTTITARRVEVNKPRYY
jgi:hypothetical protein